MCPTSFDVWDSLDGSSEFETFIQHCFLKPASTCVCWHWQLISQGYGRQCCIPKRDLLTAVIDVLSLPWRVQFPACTRCLGHVEIYFYLIPMLFGLRTFAADGDVTSSGFDGYFLKETFDLTIFLELIDVHIFKLVQQTPEDDNDGPNLVSY